MNKLLRNIISNKEVKDESSKASILHYFEERLKEFHEEFTDVEVKVTSSNSVADGLLAILEALFLHGLKETFISQLSTVIGNNVDKNVDINFWHYLLVLSPSGIVDQINSLTHITTDVGKCRAWIRSTLNDCVFRSYLMSAIKFRRYIIKFYNKTAIIRDPVCFKKIITLLESIDNYNFDLSLNSSLLNTWPNSTLMVAGYWTPALKNNPLYINNTQVAEAVDVNVTDMIGDLNKSEDSTSYNSSVSSSFIDTELFFKSPAVILDEDTRWNILMNQPSTSFVTSVISKDRGLPSATNENIPCNETTVNESIETDTKEDISTLETAEPQSSCAPVEDKSEPQSFYELLESYKPKENTSFDSSMVEELYKQLVPKIIEEQYFSERKESLDENDDFEVLSIHPDNLSLDLLKQYLQYLFTPSIELGLHFQDYNCKSCNETIGIDFGDYYKCNFTASYYCVHCFGSEKWPIPTNILFNWDFNQYPVSNSSSTFLSEVQYHPLFNMKSIHNKLYKANQEMTKAKKLRWKIYYLYHYLSTCKFYNPEELSKEIWPRVYFLNNIHLYSFADLQEIYSGTLFEFLERIIETCQEHVYKCAVCSQRGFICEICRDPKIIYPFNIGENYRCRHCKSLFHDKCFKEKKLCPKCERKKIRKINQTSINDEEHINN